MSCRDLLSEIKHYLAQVESQHATKVNILQTTLLQLIISKVKVNSLQIPFQYDTKTLVDICNDFGLWIVSNQNLSNL